MMYELRTAIHGRPTIVEDTYDDRRYALRTIVRLAASLVDAGKIVYMRLDIDDEDEIAIVTSSDGEVWTVVEVES